MKILIYIPQINSRLRYIFDFIFGEILLIKTEFTQHAEEFKAYEGLKINYSDSPLGDEVFFKSSPLLFETGINQENISYPSLIDDYFAFSFFLVSRYEEYLPHQRDINDRYEVKESMAYKKNFLKKPVIDNWANLVKAEIQKKYPGISFPQKKFQFVPTIDVDNAYAFREKGFVRTFGAYSRSLLKMNFDDIKERTSVLLGKENDPYDVFDYLISLQKKYGLQPIYFFLLADYGLNDKNVPHTSKRFQSLIKTVSDYAEVGIHPSYNSGENREKLRTEISRLARVLHKEILKSRQHFLKIQLPDTYRHLLQLGIKDDYTMGYASEPGFRAGTCTPFYFYDLSNETKTALKIHPFCLMEATFKYYKHTSPTNVMELMKPIMNEVKNVNGTLYTLWHNEFLSDVKEFKGWKKVFEEMVDYAAGLMEG